jgi:thiopeptide-type bacteriocin biosynthesis protein
MPSNDGSGWESVHVYLHDFARLTHFLQVCVAAISPPLDGRCFFVRYWMGGPHLRLRLREAALAPLLEQAAARYWDAHGFPSTLEPDAFYRGYASELPPGAERCWHTNGSVHRIAYEPELARYGGPAGIGLCEDEFVSDSSVILAMLGQEAPDRIEHILFGYCLVHARALAASGLYDDYARFICGSADPAVVRRQIALRSGDRITAPAPALLARHEQLVAGAWLPDHLTPLSLRLTALLARLAGNGCHDIASIMSSLLHMSFNRAGISPAREATIRLYSLSVTNEVYSCASCN